MTALRRLPLKGLYNARDLGGFPVPGGRTRFGVFLRSEAPCGLPPEDLDALLTYGVTTTIDLRSTMEQTARPSDLKKDDRFDYHPLPLFSDAAIPDGTHRQFKPWGEEYIEMLENATAWAVQTMTLAAQADGALLYHCTTGKDRTGILTALLLSVAGADRADIAADYCVSEVYLAPVYQRIRSGGIALGRQGKPLPIGPDFFRTPASAMLTLLDHLDATYGGAAAFLTSCGLSEETLEAIREKFVEA